MTSPWVPIITGGAAILAALIALIGVHYGQWFQTQREHQARVEQWQREDRHRFTERKQEIYSDLLTELRNWHRDLTDFELSELLATNAAVRLEKWANVHDDVLNYPEGQQHINLLLSKAQLVSEVVRESAVSVRKSLETATWYYRGDARTKNGPDLLEVGAQLTQLVDVMRSDLHITQ
ncbi:hypothetical protein [Lentzea sp. NPDC092896]|uniref:hypothetical protein n=1 Tax=Lentzea sp. NPDC092896 TaxID=3364127 RepID=UPI003804F048